MPWRLSPRPLLNVLHSAEARKLNNFQTSKLLNIDFCHECHEMSWRGLEIYFITFCFKYAPGKWMVSNLIFQSRKISGEGLTEPFSPDLYSTPVFLGFAKFGSGFARNSQAALHAFNSGFAHDSRKLRMPSFRASPSQLSTVELGLTPSKIKFPRDPLGLPQSPVSKLWHSHIPLTQECKLVYVTSRLYVCMIVCITGQPYVYFIVVRILKW